MGKRSKKSEARGTIAGKVVGGSLLVLLLGGIGVMLWTGLGGYRSDANSYDPNQYVDATPAPARSKPRPQAFAPTAADQQAAAEQVPLAKLPSPVKVGTVAPAAAASSTGSPVNAGVIAPAPQAAAPQVAAGQTVSPKPAQAEAPTSDPAAIPLATVGRAPGADSKPKASTGPLNCRPLRRPPQAIRPSPPALPRYRQPSRPRPTRSHRFRPPSPSIRSNATCRRRSKPSACGSTSH